MDQLVHDFNTALDETAGSNSSSRSSASRRKVTTNPDSYLQPSLDISCNSPGSGGARVRVISTLAITSVMTAAPVWTTLAFSPGTGARAVCNSGEDTIDSSNRLNYFPLVIVTWRLQGPWAPWSGRAGAGPRGGGVTSSWG